MKRLTAQQARRLADAEDDVARAKDDLQAGTEKLRAKLLATAGPLQEKVAAAERERDELRARYRPRLPIGEVVRAGGVRVLLDVVKGNRTFRIAQYLDAGNKVTNAMEPHYGPGTESDRWTVVREAA